MKPLGPPRPCGDCGAAPGEYHDRGCDVERCSLCGGQAISCNCLHNEFATEGDLDDDGDITDEAFDRFQAERSKYRKPWDGYWPGVLECREFGMWAKPARTIGWVKCDEDDPEAEENLNRLVMTCDWDRAAQRFVRREDQS